MSSNLFVTNNEGLSVCSFKYESTIIILELLNKCNQMQMNTNSNNMFKCLAVYFNESENKSKSAIGKYETFDFRK